MNEKERQDYLEQQRKLYPLGTVLWKMRGYHHHGKIYWAPFAHSIEQHAGNGFNFDAIPRRNGSSWNNIGKNYHLSREECLAKWGDKPLIEVDNRPPTEQESPDPKEYGKLVIWRDNSVDIVTIETGHGRGLTAASALAWHKDAEVERYVGNGDYLTLDEIRDQLWADGQTIIEVRVESPMHGVISRHRTQS